VGITADSRKIPGRNACDRKHTYRIIIITIIIIIKVYLRADSTARWPVTERAQICIEGESQLHTIHLSKTSKEKNKNIEKKRQIQAAKEETYNI